MKYSLGLDIGISSVGWAVVNLNKYRIEDLGVRAFNAAEDPKTKAPLAEPRRIARGTRRRLRRLAGRMRRAKELFVEYGLIQHSQAETAFITDKDKPSPWQLRAEALDRLLDGEELARALYHIAKRRGFKSNRKHDKTGEDGVMLASIEQNRKMLAEKGYRTAGEMLCLDEKYAEHKRNRGESYENTVDRAMLEDEIRIIFKTQRDLGSMYAASKFEAEFMEIFLWQMPFSKGTDVLDKVGNCTFEDSEKRAPKNSWTAERFVLLDTLNRLSISNNGSRRRLTHAERESLISLAYKNKDVKYTQARKILELPADARFVGLPYTKREGRSFVESFDCEKSILCKLHGYHEIRSVFTNAGVWDRVSDDYRMLDDIAYALTFYKTDEDIRAYFDERGIRDGIVDAALKLPGFSKVSHLSIKAMRKIIPHLEQGKFYSEACEAAGYNHYDPKQSDKKDKLPPIDPDDVRNPVVLRALSQARKVVNALIGKYGQPYMIHIELARDIGKTADERAIISRRIEKSRKDRQEDREHFEETFKREPVGDCMVKWRLYREQNGQCAYSQKPFDLERLFEPGYAEIDHILPYSRSFDDSFANRVLVSSAENQRKQNRTPYECFGDDIKRWDEFEVWVKATIRDHKKAGNLLSKDYLQRQEDWLRRNLNDTQYIARFFSNYVKLHLRFADPEVKQSVVCFNGHITALVRGLWGLSKDREENDLHHAQDAAVAAVLTPGMIKTITEYRKAAETGALREVVNYETGEVFDVIKNKRFAFPQPWKNFRSEVLARISDDPARRIDELGLASYSDMAEIHSVMVSRMPVRKVSGAIHLDTIRSVRYQEEKRVSVIRKKLKDLKMADMDKLYDPDNNKMLYQAIRERLEQFGGDGKKAFSEEFRKPTKDGKLGPLVRRVKIYESQPSGVEVREGIADNGGIVRTDVFEKNGKYYLVPVYVSDFMLGKLPNRAVVAHKPCDEWPIVDESYSFMFSLYPYDLVCINSGKGMGFWYYKSCHRDNGSLIVSPPNKVEKASFGVRSADVFDKYEVGVLGDYHRVSGEVRLGVEDSCNNKSGEAED